MMLLAQRLATLFGGDPPSAGYDMPLLEPDERALIAHSDRWTTNCDYTDDPGELCLLLGLTVGVGRVRRCMGEMTGAGIILLSPGLPPAERALFTAHGLAHERLVRWGRHTEADVWLLTGEYILPSRLAARVPVTAPLHAPTWFLTSWRVACARLRGGELERDVG